MVRLTKTARKITAGLGGALACLSGGAALADQPHEWQLGMQAAATPITERIHAFHDELLVIIFAISLFVFGLLIYVMVRFNARAHPLPSRTSHNTVIEVLWTVIPVLILVTIAIPSFKLMYYMDRVPDSKMTIKITGHQWYWEYNYPDNGNINFTSNLVDEKNLKAGQPRLLEVDNPLVVPAGTNIRVQVAGADVIHSWFVPSFGVQEYAVIGRLNEAWMNVEREGTYYGECNQICGVNHAFMPIEVKVVSQADFQKWLAEAKTKFASADAPKAEPQGQPINGSTTQLAAAEAAAAEPAKAGN
ncbi:MAG TPA: cytochrome c oxidase subunit II [Stellaceae bacterium]|nr:cytochrome c oxidase subunit II [Stellaceae bacterium]